MDMAKYHNIDLSAEILEEIVNIFVFRLFSKGELLRAIGKETKSAALILKGIAGSYYVDEDGNDITRGFSIAGTVQLCLYKPGNKEWMKHYSIAKTIVLWAVEWLYYYEIWQITGDWQGGGAHPTPKACRNSDKYKEKSEDNKCMRG